MSRQYLPHLFRPKKCADGEVRLVCVRCCWAKGGLLTPPLCEGDAR